MTVLWISIGAFIMTLLGGMFAIRYKDKLHLILGFSAGALLLVAFRDLLPESFEIGTKYHSFGVMSEWVLAGFFALLLVSRFLPSHRHVHDIHEGHDHPTKPATRFDALPLIIHSLFDGIAIGLAALVPASLPIVAVAVLVHDFSDGINTVNLVFRNRGEKKAAWVWLTLDAVAPIVGANVIHFFVIPEAVTGIVLAVLCGFFLYIGASDLLPESYHAHPTRWTTFMTVVGAGVLYAAIKLAGI